jgi:hypothetical protein
MDTNHADNFIDDEVQSVDQGVSQQYTSWRDLPDWEEGLSELLTRILEHSQCAAPRRVLDDNKSTCYTAALMDEVVRSPGPHDYPLCKVRCRVSRRRLL